jgi:hypothetical protein
MPYSFQVHTHRFAAWCAATAASASPKCRFSVRTGIALIESTDLHTWGRGWKAVPRVAKFEKAHQELREEIVQRARCLPKITGVVSHGVAAKLINCYLKPIYACGAEPTLPDERNKLAALHPPIDRVLLNSLAKASDRADAIKWREWRDKGWSTFTSQQYDDVIAAVRSITSRALWEIEENWKGYQ